jgi:hypothetical protein
MNRLLLFLIPVVVIAAVISDHGKRCAAVPQSAMPVCE